MNLSEYWNKKGASYSLSWAGIGKELLSKKEMEFINNYLKKSKPKIVLDVGVGNGRIINNYLDNLSEKAKIFGIDISETMIGICKKRFAKEFRVRSLKVADFSKLKNIAQNKFNFITAIRVLNYNPDWEKMIDRAFSLLDKNGIFIFTMLNKRSVNYFSRPAIVSYKITLNELKIKIKSSGFKILEIKSLSRIPDCFYNSSKNIIGTSFLNYMEKLLSRIFGKTDLGKVFYIAVKK